MNIYPKHYLVGALGVVLSGFIFYVNRDFLGAEFDRSVNISILTFFLWLFCWLLYFEFRDIWNYRWLWKKVDLNGIEVKSFFIPLDSEINFSQNIQSMQNPQGNQNQTSNLYAELLFSPSLEKKTRYPIHLE